jgi:hypothetical protein
MSTAVQAPTEPALTDPRHLDPLDGLGIQNLDPLVRQVVQRLAVDVAVLRERLGGAERDLRSQESALRELRQATDYNAAMRPEIDDFRDQMQVDMKSMAEQCKLEAKALVKVLREEMMSQSIEWRRTNASLSALRTEFAQKQAPQAPRSEDLKSMESRLLENMHQQAAAIRNEMSLPYSDLKKDLDVARQQAKKVELDVGAANHSFATKEHVQSYINTELHGVRLEEKRLEMEVKEMSARLSELEHVVSEEQLAPPSQPASHGQMPGPTAPTYPSPTSHFTDTTSSPPLLGASSLGSTTASLPPLKTATSPNKSMSPVSKTDQSDTSPGPRGVQDLRRELVAMRFT